MGELRQIELGDGIAGLRSVASKVRDASGHVVARVATARVDGEYHMHVVVNAKHPSAGAMRLEPGPNVGVFVYHDRALALRCHEWACRGLTPDGGTYGLAEHHQAGF